MNIWAFAIYSIFYELIIWGTFSYGVFYGFWPRYLCQRVS